MRRQWALIGMMVLGCGDPGPGESADKEAVGDVQQAWGEYACAQAPAVGLLAESTDQVSPNGAYGATMCPNAYVVEVTTTQWQMAYAEYAGSIPGDCSEPWAEVSVWKRTYLGVGGSANGTGYSMFEKVADGPIGHGNWSYITGRCVAESRVILSEPGVYKILGRAKRASNYEKVRVGTTPYYFF